MSKQTEALKLALEALELAQDNLRPHGDNCFLHDEGEYNSCFCGKDSLSDHLQSVVEKLDEALAQPQQKIEYCTNYYCAGDCGQPHNQKEMREFLASQPQQEPVAWWNPTKDSVSTDPVHRHNKDCQPLYTSPPAQQQEPVAWATQINEYGHIHWGAKRPEYPMVYEFPLYTPPPAQRKPLTDEEFLELILRTGTQELVGVATFVGGSIQMQGKIGLLRSAKIIKEFVEAAHQIGVEK